MFKFIAKLFAGTTTVTPARKVRLGTEGMEDRYTPAVLLNSTAAPALGIAALVGPNSRAAVEPTDRTTTGGIWVQSAGGTVSIPSIPPGSGALTTHGVVTAGG